MSFQILHLFFINNNTTVNQISTELFISRSFCYKTIDALVEPLKGWHIELNLSSKRDSPN
ncbi:helix-turn-helix domain-containing protein, partial [Brochothrix thermosphacta]